MIAERFYPESMLERSILSMMRYVIGEAVKGSKGMNLPNRHWA